jgi:hypothetical protein
VTGSRKWKFPPSNAAGWFGPILILIALASAVPRLLLGASEFIEYDGYWHIFVALQDDWTRFWADAFATAHPPLYFLVLKPFLHLGHSLLVYRSVSILAGVASVFQVGWIARKVTGSNIRSWQSALLYGLALPGIVVSCEVRSYTLSIFFVLLSFSYFLDIPVAGNGREEAKPRAGFAAGAILAFLTHYFAFFYAGAAIALLLGRYVVCRYRGAKANWRAEAATSVPVAAAMYTLYKVHASKLGQAQEAHLVPFYYDPNGHETAAAFLIRNWKNFVNLFSPLQLSSDAAALAVLILAVIAGLWLSARARKTTGVRASWTIRMTAMMLAGIALASLAAKYPFGGDLRQQYLLFPFLVLCLAIAVEHIAAGMSDLVPVRGRLLANTLVIAAIVGFSVAPFYRYPRRSERVLADQMAVFDRLEPAPKAVYLDQFSLIAFFTFHDSWDWSLVKLPQPIPGIDVYRLRRGPDEMLVFREGAWNVDPDDASVYAKLAECLRAEKIQDLSLFGPRQTPPKPELSDPRGVRGAIVTLASGSGLCVQRLKVNPVGWYATFRQSNCAPVDLKVPQVTGTFDDINEDIVYTGLWSHAAFEEAAGGTVSFSNSPGAVARVSFEGSEITWVYTRAFNRGIAEVKLDGIAHGEIDLYSPKIVWQARKTFDGLTPGRHTLEIIVAGRKQAAATDQYVDVDALIVH